MKLLGLFFLILCLRSALSEISSFVFVYVFKVTDDGADGCLFLNALFEISFV